MSTETYLAKVRRGEKPTPDEGLAFLRAWHAGHPGATSLAIADRLLPDGRSSYDLLASCVPAGADASVVDLACGDGLLAGMLGARLGVGARVLGLDASEDDLALARARGGPPRVTFANGVASTIPTPTASVDAVLCHYALMLFVPLEPVVAEIARVLVPGGTFAAVLPAMFTVAATSPALQARVAELRAADLPAFPELGLVDPRLTAEGPAAFFHRASGFDEPLVITTHTAIGRWSLARVVASFRDVYWFDLLRPGTQATLLSDAESMLAAMGEPLEVHTEMRLIVGERSRS